LTLLLSGLNVLVLDNLSNSTKESLKRVAKICGCKPIFYEGDVRNRSLLEKIFKQNSIDSVIHFAGLKAVGESVLNPLDYFDNNVSGSLTLFQAMADAGIYKLIFSSSATVYGQPIKMPVSETSLISRATNPYGRSKLIIEDMLKDLVLSDPRWNIAILRYFNPIGAHESGLIGEYPRGIPNNLLPQITQVALGKLRELVVFGNDYPTPDGTAIRDYVHVMDLAEGHLRALEVLGSHSGANVWNLGTGQGYSVLEIIRAFELASGKRLPWHFANRRPGDVGICYADVSKAERELNWKATRGLSQMMIDSWRWQHKNPYGYA
jgi:UDP-glucose 4-epimerase